MNTHDELDYIAHNIQIIKQQIAHTIEKYDRTKPTPDILAVSKYSNLQSMLKVAQVGILNFAESKLQDAQQKIPLVKQEYPQAKFHFIGPLQSNKIKKIVHLFDSIHSLDRIKIANYIAKACNELNVNPPIYIQVNIGNEKQKSGVVLSDLHKLYIHSKKIGLNVVGLMAIPPRNIITNGNSSHPPFPYFMLLKKLAQELQLYRYSFGMSSDYISATVANSSVLRIGSAIFNKDFDHNTVC